MRHDVRWWWALLLLATGPAGAGGHDEGPRYVLVPLGSLGGSTSGGNGINDRGTVEGTSQLPDGRTHATLWRGRKPIDLGTLGGPNSAILWPSKAVNGLVAGVAETDVTQPRGERWSCSFFFPVKSGKTCRGVVWDHGRIRALPTLGGDNGFATGVNDRRQVVGWAENTVLDPSCVGVQKLQFRAVLWGPGENELRELPPFGSDSTSAATALNDHGQVVGISGACGIAVGGVSATHAVLWERGVPVDLGTLGGEGWNTPMAINAWGEVVGFANAPAHTADDPLFLPFRWTRARGIEPLPLLPGHDNGQALGINLWGQTVGVSCAGGDCRGVLWTHGRVLDLGPRMHGLVGTIVNAGDIDDLGRIAGQSFDPATGLTTAFRAIPAGWGHGSPSEDEDEP
jgi:probable HAF family extracellular repeat protein